MSITSIFTGKALKGGIVGALLLSTAACATGGGGGMNGPFGGDLSGGHSPAPQPAATQSITVTGSPCPRGTAINNFPDVHVAFQQCGATAVKLGPGPNGFIATTVYDLSPGNKDRRTNAEAFSRDFASADQRQSRIDEQGFARAGRKQSADPLKGTQDGLNSASRTIGAGRNIVNQINGALNTLRRFGM